jgi:hypothetical protein
MQAEPSLAEGRAYVGRSVRKLFVTPGTTRLDWYTGSVKAVWLDKKRDEIYYRIACVRGAARCLGMPAALPRAACAALRNRALQATLPMRAERPPPPVACTGSGMRTMATRRTSPGTR